LLTYGDAGLIVLVTVILVSAVSRSLKRKCQETSNELERYTDDQPRNPKLKVPLSRRYADYDHPTEHEHRTAEQFNWRNANRLNVFIAVAAGVAAIFAAGSFYETRRQADLASKALIASQDAAEAARMQAENMDRPWVKLIDLERVALNFAGPGMPYTFGVPGEPIQANLSTVPNLKNVGKTVATHIHVQVQLVVHKWENGWADFADTRKETCANAEKNTGYDATLFPDDPFDAFGTGSSVILSEKNISTAGPIKYVAPAIVGCIVYQFATSPKHHRTMFVYEMFQANDRSRVFELGKDTKGTAILLIRDSQYDYAD
jgi:hypothetical protein